VFCEELRLHLQQGPCREPAAESPHFCRRIRGTSARPDASGTRVRAEVITASVVAAQPEEQAKLLVQDAALLA
jgi:hypothetical protein